MPDFDRIDLMLLQRLHGELPLTERPFADVAHELGLVEDEVLARLRAMHDSGIVTRLGPLFQIERAGGRFVLAALEVPESRFDAVAEQVNSFPEVAHNYRREHRLNMWFVIATETPERIATVCRDIETLTGLAVWAFPKEREYFVELRLPLNEPEQQA